MTKKRYISSEDELHILFFKMMYYINDRWQQATYILQEIYEGVCGSHKRMGFGTKGVEIGILLAYNKKDA